MRVLVRIIVAVAGLLALLFGTAGRWDIPVFWAYLGVLIATFVAAIILMDPGLKNERMHPPAGGTDRSLRWIVMPFFMVHLALAGLDVGRFHWSAGMPPAVSLVGLAILIASYAVTIWAMHTNRFYSPVVRIQEERGHHIITGGPYRYVRHPGYAAAIGCCIGSTLTFGSWISFLPLVPVLVLILRRTIIEDRFLHAHLEGYAAFARQTRYRWVPGLF